MSNNLLIKNASNLIKNNKLVILPTETVYGIGANAYSHDAVKKIFNIKKRPFNKPLIIHYSSIEQIEQDAFMGECAYKLACAFWPGPLTLILNKKLSSQISSLAISNSYSIGVRIPNHQMCLDVLRYSERPIAMPSANMYQTISNTNVYNAINAFANNKTDDSDIPHHLNGGKCQYGLESTIIDCRLEKSIYILRHGAITADQIKNVLGYFPKFKKAYLISGSDKVHYCTKKPIRLNATHVESGEALLSFGRHDIKSNNLIELNLSLNANLSEASQNLFYFLNKLDQSDAKSIAVMSIPKENLGIAINDRLEKAAFKHSSDENHAD